MFDTTILSRGSLVALHFTVNEALIVTPSDAFLHVQWRLIMLPSVLMGYISYDIFASVILIQLGNI